jgi:hypothetical protein
MPSVKPTRDKVGRPPGKTPKRLERDAELERIRQHVYNNADKLVATQMSIAHGTNYIVKITKTATGLQSELVTDPKELAEALKLILDPKKEGKGDKKLYYQIRTDKPDARAIENLLDRAFGRPTQPLEQGDKEKPFLIKIDQ